MGEEAERIARAQEYVTGSMNEADRERAEHDLAYDPAFRDAVLRLAQATGRIANPGDGQRWSDVATNLSALPQMRSALPPAAQATVPPAAKRSVAGQPAASRPITGGSSGKSFARLRLQMLLLAAVAFIAGAVVGRVSAAWF
jgi:anti-sigma factor RsiW